MNRRTFLLSLAAPAVITTAGLLMPVRKPLWTPAEPMELSMDGRPGFSVSAGGSACIIVYDSLGKAYRIPVAL